MTSTFAQCGETAAEWQPLYDAFVDGLKSRGVGAGAPKVGDLFPGFSLPDVNSRFRALPDLVRAGTVVVSFNRGGWCPYCRAELEAWGRVAPELKAMNATLVVITGEVGGRAQALTALTGPDAVILSDVDHGVSLAAGLAVIVSTDLVSRYVECGLHLEDIYGTLSNILPIPATFVLNAEGRVRYAFVEPDFRLRAEPLDVLKRIREAAV